MVAKQRSYLTNRYIRARRLNIELINLDASALAGYYLINFPKDPRGALNVDIKSLKVSAVVGNAAKALILAAIDN